MTMFSHVRDGSIDRNEIGGGTGERFEEQEPKPSGPRPRVGSDEEIRWADPPVAAAVQRSIDRTVPEIGPAKDPSI